MAAAVKNCWRKGSKTTYNLQWNQMSKMPLVNIYRTYAVQKTHFSTHSSKNQVPAESMWILYLRLFLYTFHFKDRIVRVVHYFVNILADISLGKIMCWCVWNNLWKLSKLLSSLGKWLALSWNNLFPWGYLSWTGEKKTVSVFFRSVCFYFTCHGISQHKLISTSPQLLCGSAVLWICVCLNNWPGPNIGLSQIS